MQRQGKARRNETKRVELTNLPSYCSWPFLLPSLFSWWVTYPVPCAWLAQWLTRLD